MDIGKYFESIKGNKAKLRQFFAAMPKGGDLHNHLTGSSYAELYFYIACNKRLRVDMETGKLLPAKGDISEKIIRLTHDMENLHKIRMTLIDKWSVRNFQPYKYSLGPDEYFFGQFGLFNEATTRDVLPSLLHELVLRAKEENVQYLEVMGISPSVSGSATCFLKKDTYDAVKSAIENYCPNSSDVNSAKSTEDEVRTKIVAAIDDYESLYADMGSDIYKAVQTYLEDNNVLIKEGLQSGPNASFITSRFDTVHVNSDDVLVKLQGYASRGNADPVAVLAQLYIVHKVMSFGDSPVVGCNIVAAENSENSMRYYNAHMIMFAVLREKYASFTQPPQKTPHTALHAGELTVGLIRPEHLTFHIAEAVNVAKADRIGHGVDISFEHNSQEILTKMKKDKIPVEINLTSNEFILGVKEDSHPFHVYLDNGIPLILSTDDPGILRTSLTEEYAIAAYRYNLSYDQIKQIVKNSIEYSFLSENDKNSQRAKLQNSFKDFESKFEMDRVSEVLLSGFGSCRRIQWTVTSQCQQTFKVELSQKNSGGDYTTLMVANKSTSSAEYTLIQNDSKVISGVDVVRLSIGESGRNYKYKIITKSHDVECYGDKKCITYSIFVEDQTDDDFNDIYINIVGWQYLN